MCATLMVLVGVLFVVGLLLAAGAFACLDQGELMGVGLCLAGVLACALGLAVMYDFGVLDDHLEPTVCGAKDGGGQ